MNKIFVFCTFLMLIGCSPPITQVSTTNGAPHFAIVKNTLWQTVRTVKLDSSARSTSDPTYAEIQAQIAADNALSLTSQEWVYLDTAPDIANAPNGNVFYVRPDTGVPVASFLNLTRQYIFDNYQNFLSDAKSTYGGDTIYIDHIPPAPVLAKDTTPYEWYSIYVIEDAPTVGTKLFENHAGYNSDETWSGQWITTPEGQFYNGTPGGGWATIDAYFSQMTQTYQTEVVSPQLYWPGVKAAHVLTSHIYPPLPISIP